LQIQTDMPVGLWGGASCLSIDVGDQACGSAHQRIPPIAALGHRYAGQEETVSSRVEPVAYVPGRATGEGPRPYCRGVSWRGEGWTYIAR